MVNIEKCLEFITLQNEINHDIDTTGETSPWKAAQLDLLVEKLSIEDGEWIVDTLAKAL
jgi:hypothetical protein